MMPSMRGSACALILLLTVLPGCDRDSGSGIVARGKTDLVDPYQGTWKFNSTKTIALWEQQQEMPAEQIAYFQKLGPDAPLHPDVKIEGTTIVLADITKGKYALFALHRHGAVTCGKAWFQDDRDWMPPSKHYVRLELKGPDLYFSACDAEGSRGAADPDRTNIQATAPAATCATDSATSSWLTYVLGR